MLFCKLNSFLIKIYFFFCNIILKFVYEFINRGLNDLICINLMWLFKSFNFKIEVIIMVLCNIEIRLIYIFKEKFLLCFDMILIVVNIIFGRKGGGGVV